MPEAIWNLCDALSPADGPRRFAMPMVRLADRVAPELFHLNEYTTPDPATATTYTTDVRLQISLRQPASALQPSDGLPHPALRLFAVDYGTLVFLPADATFGPRLQLHMWSFARPDAMMPAWWMQWIAAACIPLLFIYEYVDSAELRRLTDLIRTRATAPAGMRLPSIPARVAQHEHAAYLNRFLAGDPQAVLEVRPGDYLGSIRNDTAADLSSNPLRLNLRAAYAPIQIPRRNNAPDPDWEYLTLSTPYPPMNPREFFALLFGEDSPEARTHPILQRMQQQGSSEQTDLHPETRRMLLRPPLRTWKRLIWEADQEQKHHAYAWRPRDITPLPTGVTADKVNSLGPQRFFNARHPRRSSSGSYVQARFANGTYRDSWKCNLFVGDISIRAGFRAVIHGAVPPIQFVAAGRYATIAQRTQPFDPMRGVPLFGAGDDRSKIWGFKLDPFLERYGGDTEALLNDMMHQQGRGIILAGWRRPPPPRRSGHIVFLEQVLAQPTFATVSGEGRQVQAITIRTREAASVGASSRDETFGLAGTSATPDSARSFTRLHLIDLAPGLDPDTLQGLRDLNTRG